MILYTDTASISNLTATGSLYGTASFAVTASYLMGYVPSTLVSSSISSSWASSSLSSSVSLLSNTASYVTSSNVVGTVNSASYSFSSSYAPLILPSQISVNGITASFTGSHTGTLIGTASWSNNSTSASYVPNLYPVTTVPSSSWASSSISSSYAAVAGAINFIPNLANTASYVTASNVVGAINSSLTASYLNKGANIYLSQSYITSVVGATSPSFSAATMYWDDDAKTYAIYSDISGSSTKVGQQQTLRCYAGEYIPAGSPVYVTSSVGFSIPVIKLAISDYSAGSVKPNVVGISNTIINSGSIGLVTGNGQVRGLNTLGYTSGQALYLSNTSSGSFSTVIPPHPYVITEVGYVLAVDAASGSIQVSTTNIVQNTYPFVGMTTLPTITTGSAGQVYIGAAYANLSLNSSGVGPVQNYQIPSASFTIDTSPFNTQYIAVSYNNGNPIYTLATDDQAIDEIQTTLVYTLVYRTTAAAVSVIGWDTPGNLLPNKLLHRFADTMGISLADGLILGVSSSLYATITSGSVWVGSQNTQLPACNSNVNRFVLVAHSASAWSQSIVTQMTNTQCDNGTNVVALGGGPNHWTSNYIYRGVGNLNTMFVFYGSDYATLSAAQIASPPAVPSEFLDTTILIGRVIYQKSTVPAVEIDSAFTTMFAPSGISNHNDLNGLQGGASGEYYHLTSASYASIVINGTSSYATTASYAPNLYPVTTVASSSWASSSISSSYATIANASNSSSVSLTTTNAAYYLDLSAGTSGNQPVYVASGLTYNPSTGLLNPVSTTEQLRLGYNTSNYVQHTVNSNGGITYNSTGSLPSYTFNVNTNTSSLFISASGKVGIGTQIPVNKLDVVGNISCSVITASMFYGTASFASYASGTDFAIAAGNTLYTASYANNAGNITNVVGIQSNNYNILTTDSIIIMSGSSALSVSLPALSSGKQYTVKNVSPYNLTLTSSVLVDNTYTWNINQFSSMTVIAGTTQYYII